MGIARDPARAWKTKIRIGTRSRRLERLAWLLDSSIPIPGTRSQHRLEALIGLVPFLGDLVGVLLSSTILAEAARLGVGKSVLARMAFNIALEGLVGLIPLAGDVFDAAWKANQRNVRLLDAWLDRPGARRALERAFSRHDHSGAGRVRRCHPLLTYLLLRWLVA